MNGHTLAALLLILLAYALVQAIDEAATREAQANPQWQAQQIAAYTLKGK